MKNLESMLFNNDCVDYDGREEEYGECDNGYLWENKNGDVEHHFHSNCGGFALGIASWYQPYDKNKWCHLDHMYCHLDNSEEILKECVDYMLQDILELRVIEKEEDANHDEDIVFFRVGIDYCDFHYVLKTPNGYIHKLGHAAIKEIEKEEVYSDGWCFGRYDSDMVIFALKNREEQGVRLWTL